MKDVSASASSHPPGAKRIGLILARSGVASRRAAEALIAAGRVSINGIRVVHPATFATPDDRVCVDRKPIAAPGAARLWRYHKPRGLITTAHDPGGRPTVFDHLPRGLGRLIAVGRLDVASEGLLLLTNDGGLARLLELPKSAWTRRYRVRVHGEVDEERLRSLAKGVDVAGFHYRPIEATLDARTGTNAWLSVTLREGRNREIRRVMESLDLEVNRLIRVAFGPFELGTLPRGELAEVPPKLLHDKLPEGAP